MYIKCILTASKGIAAICSLFFETVHLKSAILSHFTCKIQNRFTRNRSWLTHAIHLLLGSFVSALFPLVFCNIKAIMPAKNNPGELKGLAPHQDGLGGGGGYRIRFLSPGRVGCAPIVREFPPV